MNLGRAPRTSLSEHLADQLRAAIQDGTYPAGAKLPTEAELSATTGVGRTTVREAVRALVSEGVLVSRQGSGVYSTGYVPLRQRLSIAALVEVFHARCAIETYAAGLACAHRDADDLAALDRALAERDRVPPRTSEFAEHDIAFHRQVVAASKNTILLEVFTALEPRLIGAFVDSRFLDRAGQHQAEVHVRAHYELVAAIRDRDTEQALRLSRLLQTGAIAVLEREQPTPGLAPESRGDPVD